MLIGNLIFQTKQFFYNIRHFYPKLLVFDAIFFLFYCFRNPYRMAKKKGKSNVYGETPYRVYDLIAKECALTSGQRFMELGSGRGKGLFFMSHIHGVRSLGVEWHLSFVRSANLIKKLTHTKKVQCLYGDFTESIDNECDVMYIYGTCLVEEGVKLLIKRLIEIQCQALIVTVSYPLNAFNSSFILKKELEVKYPWGITKLYIQKLLQLTSK